MKTGVSLFSFTADADLKNIFCKIKAAGYDGAEPVLSENGYLNPNSTVAQIKEIKNLADDFGLEIPSVGVWALWENNLISNDAKTAKRAMDIVKKQIEAAHLLGADTILIVPGYVGCDFASEPERVRYDIAYDRCRSALEILAPEAEKANVNIGIENVWNRFLLSPLEMKRLIKEVGSPNVGVYFDVGNIMYIGYPGDWIEILDTDIKKIHLSDYRTSQSGLGAFVDLFAGDVDFKEVAQSLNKIGYDDYVILEMLPNYRQFPEVSIVSNKTAVDKIVELASSVE